MFSESKDRRAPVYIILKMLSENKQINILRSKTLWLP